MVTPLGELLESGRLGQEGVAALYGAVAAVARFDHYPPPDDHDRWDAAAVRDVAADFVAGPRATERLVQLAVMATDDASFGRLLEAAVRNHFRSRARRTAAGKLHRRLRRVLGSAVGIIEVSDGVFAIEGHLEPVARGYVDALIPAAWAVELGPESGQLDVDGNVRVSLPVLERLCRAVLAEAGGPLALNELLYVVGARLGLGEPPLLVDIDVQSFSSLNRRPDDEAVDILTAEEVFDALTERERVALIVLDESVRDAARFAGVGKSSMAQTMARLRTRLARLIPDDAQRGPVLAKLLEMAVSWAGNPKRESPDRTHLRGV